jgi:hypothetical protein
MPLLKVGEKSLMKKPEILTIFRFFHNPSISYIILIIIEKINQLMSSLFLYYSTQYRNRFTRHIRQMGERSQIIG